MNETCSTTKTTAIDFSARRRFLKTTLYVTLGASGLQACGSLPQAAGAAADQSGPVPAAQIDAALAQLDPLVSSLLASSGIPGIAVAVVQGSRTVFAKGYGVSSSVNDMAKWMSMVLTRGRTGGTQLIPEAALLPAMSKQILAQPAHDGKPAGYYGFGFNVGTTDGGRPMVNHSGAFLLGAATFFMIVPSTDLGIVVLTNAWPIGVAEAIGLQFFDLVQFGAPSKDWAATLAPLFASMTAPQGSLVGVAPVTEPAPAQPFSAYTGTYRNDYYGPMQVGVRNGGLVLTLGPGNAQFACQHWDGDTFSIQSDNESSPPGSTYKVVFAGSPAARVTAEFFDEGGLDVFAR